MLNRNHIVVFDFETGSVNPQTCEVLQIAACVIDARRLELFPDTFNAYVKPLDESKVEAEALKVNKIDLTSLRDKPTIDAVWPTFVNFVNKYNKKPGNGWEAPIAAGHNIKNFDMIIAERLCNAYGFVDKRDSKWNIFNKRFVIDTIDMLFPWFENNVEPADAKLDSYRDYFGISKEGAHNALVDVKQCAAIIQRFLRFHRKIAQKTSFKGAFANATD
jgi:DNA polymerase III epsilon subunit-like protein